MGKKKPSKTQLRLAKELVSHFEAQRDIVTLFRDQVFLSLQQSPALEPFVHSIKSRIKDPTHLKNKILRQLMKADETNQQFDVTSENLLTKISDLAGIRILHLHTRQLFNIDKTIKDILEEQRYELIEGPFARTWDDESREFYRKIGIETQDSETMYTSVHYVIGSASKTRTTCEIQVRTLAEEVWGEVDHSINYPHPVDHLACREQIRALARATSTVTRLVDSIFATFDDLESKKKATADTKRKVVGGKRASGKTSKK